MWSRVVLIVDQSKYHVTLIADLRLSHDIVWS